MRISKILSIHLFLLFGMPAFSALNVNMYMGDVSFMTQDSGSWESVSVGQTLKIGDTIMTEANSFVELAGGGTTIKVNENSKIILTESMDPEAKGGFFSMLFGTLSVKAKKLSKDEESVNVVTPSCTAAVRGTEFIIASGHDGQSIVQVLEGSVSLKGESREVMINKDQESGVELGGEPKEVTIIKKREWHKWADDSKKNIKGNEEKILAVCVAKIEKLGGDIMLLEKTAEKSKQLREEYRNKAVEFKKNGDKKNMEEYAGKAHAEGRSANTSVAKIRYNTHKMGLIRDVADRAYNSMEKKNNAADALYKKIKDTHDKNYNKYLRKVKKAEKK